LQFVNGHLAVGETLRLMEQATQDAPEQMQKGFASFSDCASKGMFQLKTTGNKIMLYHARKIRQIF
jgi:hypothetical protein